MDDDNIIKLPVKKKSAKKPKVVLDSGIHSQLKGTYTIIDHIFFTPGGDMQPVLVVLVEEPSRCYVVSYIGTGTDKQWVASWGTKLTRGQAEAIFGYKIPDYKKG